MALFTGCGVALVTPFTEQNTVNFDKIAELLEWHLTQDTDAVIVCGTTGEAPTLNDDEHKEILRFAVETVKKRIPVIAGTGSNNTAHAIMMSQYAQKVGADGLLCVTPYYNKTTQRGLLASYRAIADSVEIPIILYNVPSRTGVNILPETVAKLAEHRNIAAVKEASGNIAQVAEIARLVPDDFRIYSGNDDMIVPIMSLKGAGVISTVANILPRETHNLVHYFLDNRVKASCELQLRMKPVIDAVFIEVNPIPIKAAMNLLGLDVGKPRLPLVELEDAHLDILRHRLHDYGLMKDTI